MAKSFDVIIEDTLDDTEKKVMGEYKVPSRGGALNIDKKDHASFKKLFTKKPNAGVGNGEVSLYWLFNYGKKNNRAAENRGGDAADLILDKKNCEVKSYPSHDSMTLGKFKSDLKSQEIITYLFAFSNLFVTFGKSTKGSKSFKSLLQFNVTDIADSIVLYNSMFSLFANNKHLYSGQTSYPLFVDIKKSMDALKTKIKSVSRSNFTNANKVAGDIVAHFVMTKFGNKPGEGGYMVNCKKGMDKRTITSLDVHFHLIATKNFNNDYETLKKSFSVNSGEIQIKLNGLFG